METRESKISSNEIMQKLTRLQADVDYIKAKLALDDEIELWEQILTEDSADFFEKNNL